MTSNNWPRSTLDLLVGSGRLTTLALVLALLASLMVACSGDEDDATTTATTEATTTATETSTATEAATATEAPADSAYPVTIEHEFGSTTIEEKPTRIVAAGFNEIDFVLAFGEVPVGIREWLGSYPEESRPWAVDLIGDTEIVLIGANEIDFEVVASLEPDLIMAVYAFIDEAAYDLLSGIAPTVAAPAGGATWDVQTLMTGQALGQTERAEELIADIDAQFAEVAATYPDFAGKSLAILWGVSDPGSSYYLLPETDLRAQFFYNLGFVPPGTTGEISPDRADLVDQDVIVVFGWTEEQMADDPLFQGLSAVQDGRVVYFAWDSDLAGALGFSSPLSIPYVIELAAPALDAALSGE